MMKKLISFILTMCVAFSAVPAVFASEDAAAADETNTGSARQMEVLGRGAFAAALPGGGVYLSWRLLGSEPMDTVFNLYKNGALLISELDNTNYTDKDGTGGDKYTVAPVINGAEGEKCADMPMLEGRVNSGQENAPYAYFDIPIQIPDPETDTYNQQPSSGGANGGANDVSVGDVDGDGEYEIILKWNPKDSKDNSENGVTSNVYIDCYEYDGTLLWRLDLGRNIRAGAHYTQFQVYDYDGDGKAEVVMRTAPGSKDGAGAYVTEVGVSDTIKTADNTKVYVNSRGQVITGPEYLTVFNGETGKAMQTIEYEPGRGSAGAWGDDYGGRSERFLAGTAYLDGVHPSMIFARGYYQRSSMAAFDWDGKNLTKRWLIDSGTDKKHPFYGQGNHNLSVADIDNDGKDEIVYGSAAIDDDGTVAHSMGWGHGDALHVSDFDNDGKQEIFAPLEESPNYGIGFREGDGTEIWHYGAGKDDGRGVMANFSKKYGVLAWDGLMGIRKIDGTLISDVPKQDDPNSLSSPNFCIYWDGDLLSEHLDGDRIQKFNDDTIAFERLLTFSDVAFDNTTKRNPAFQADLFGDWREEIILRRADNAALRVFTSLTPSDYKFTTFMHDSQYRCAVAWQNTAYNQPPHQSYYIGYEKEKTDYTQPLIYTIPLKPELKISVKGSDGNPVPGAVVSAGGIEKPSNADGIAAFRLEPGEYNLSVSCLGYRPTDGSVSLTESGTSQTVTLEILPEEAITVKSGGEPVEGAKITIDGQSKVTGADGTAKFRLEAGDYQYTVSRIDYVTKSGTLSVSSSGGELEIELTRESIIGESWNFDNLEKGKTYEDGENMENQNGKSITVRYGTSGLSSTTKPTITDTDAKSLYIKFNDKGNGQDGWSYTPDSPLDADKSIYEIDFMISDNTDSGVQLLRVLDSNNANTSNTYTSSTDGRAFDIITGSGTLKFTDYFSKGSDNTKGKETTVSGFSFSTKKWYSLRLEYMRAENRVNVYTKSADASEYMLNDTVTLGSGTNKGQVPKLAPTMVQSNTRGSASCVLGIDNIYIGMTEPEADYPYTINQISSADGVTVNVTKNHDFGNGKALLIAAAYDKESGALTDWTTAELSMSDGETLDVKVDLSPAETDEVSAYIWNGFDEIKPLAAKK